MKRITSCLVIVVFMSIFSPLTALANKKPCTKRELISLNQSAIDFNKNRTFFLRFLVYVKSSNEGILKSIKSNNSIGEQGYRANFVKAIAGAKESADKALKNEADIRKLLAKCKSGYGVDYSPDYGFLKMNKEVKGIRFPSFKIPDLVALPSSISTTTAPTLSPSPQPPVDPLTKCAINPSIYDTDCFDPIGDRLSSETAASGEKYKCVPYVDCKLGSLGPGGGIVFYDSGATQVGARYLEVAPVRWQRNKTTSNWVGTIFNTTIGVKFDPGSVWCTPKSEAIKSNAKSIFAATSEDESGLKNSQLLLDNCLSGAAHLARSYTGGGKTDWYLPTSTEMHRLADFVYEHKKSSYQGLRPYFDDGYYWTSNTAKRGYGAETVFAWNFSWGDGPLTLEPLRDWDKAGALVRPVRAF